MYDVRRKSPQRKQLQNFLNSLSFRNVIVFVKHFKIMDSTVPNAGFQFSAREKKAYKDTNLETSRIKMKGLKNSNAA